jgi:hypothetical protein
MNLRSTYALEEKGDPMKGFVELDVTPDARNYIGEYLTGIEGLAERLAPLIAATGSIHAIVPDGTSLERAIQFEAGGFDTGGAISHWLSPLVMARIGKSPDGLFIIQDIWADARMIKPDSSPYATSDGGSTVYYFVKSTDVSLDALYSADRDAMSFVRAMFIVPSGALPLSSGYSLSGDELDLLATRVTEFVIDAYDEESFLIWRRNSLSNSVPSLVEAKDKGSGPSSDLPRLPGPLPGGAERGVTMSEDEAVRIQSHALAAIKELSAIAALPMDWETDETLRLIRRSLGAAIWQIDAEVLTKLYDRFPAIDDLAGMDISQFDPLFRK